MELHWAQKRSPERNRLRAAPDLLLLKPEELCFELLVCESVLPAFPACHSWFLSSPLIARTTAHVPFTFHGENTAWSDFETY